MRVALVHDWAIQTRGGERVLEALAEMYPDAPIYTLFYDKTELSPVLRERRFIPSFLHYLPGIKRYYRRLLPLLPLAIKTLKARNADLVISTSNYAAKGIRVPRKALHICYCQTPARYLWGERKWFWIWMKMWDLSFNRRVDEFISTSESVKKHVFEDYGRMTQVIYPPVNTEVFYPCAEKEGFYLVVSDFLPRKRVDIVIEAFNTLDRPLIVVGSGPLEEKYRRLCGTSATTFRGAPRDEEVRLLMSRARALIFPADEPFALVPLEAQACGTPVIAFSKNGPLENVKSGVLFSEQTPAAVKDAVRRFEKKSYTVQGVSARVNRFSKEYFKNKLSAYVEGLFHEAPSRELSRT